MGKNIGPNPEQKGEGRLRFSLFHTWDRALVSVPRRLSRDSRELKQQQRRRQRERHLKI